MAHIMCCWKAFIKGFMCAAYRGVSIRGRLSATCINETMRGVTFFPRIEATLYAGSLVLPRIEATLYAGLLH